MLDREVALYRELRPHLRSITFVTYGKSRELDFQNRIGDIKVIFNRWRLPQRIYMLLLQNTSSRRWGRNVICKSNQFNGAFVALGATKRAKGKFIARGGYHYSVNIEREFGANSKEAVGARREEARVFNAANQMVVTTPSIRNSILEQHPLDPERVSVIPNFVDTDVFQPGPSDNFSSKRIVFIGRLEAPKNLISLVRSMKDVDAELLLIGTGDKEIELRQIVNDESLPVRFLGKVPNNDLPKILRSAALFVMPSHYEGHPKALLEAMACGLPVIGSDVPGICDVIQHNVNGYLCSTSPNEIRSAIEALLGNKGLRTELGANAKKYIDENCSLERVKDMELQVLKQVIQE